MIDKNTPEWQAFRNRVDDAIENHRISPFQFRLIVSYMDHKDLPMCESRLSEAINTHGEYRLMRDMWQAERDAKRRTISIVGLAVFISVVIVWMAYIAHKS